MSDGIVMANIFYIILFVIHYDIRRQLSLACIPCNAKICAIKSTFVDTTKDVLVLFIQNTNG